MQIKGYMQIKVDGSLITRQLDDIAIVAGAHLLQTTNNATVSHDTMSAVRELLLPSSVILEAINSVI